MIEYIFLTPEEIFKQISYVSGDNILGVILLVLTICLTLSMILYILPITSLTLKEISKKRNKAKRSLMIKQIAMQREIEEEIEKEL